MGAQVREPRLQQARETRVSWIPIPAVLVLTFLGAVAQGRALGKPISAGAGWYALAYWVNLIAQLFLWHAPLYITIFIALLALFFTWIWWKRHRDKRKRALALIGAKSRALRDALVRKLRQSRVRGGVPAPQPA